MIFETAAGRRAARRARRRARRRSCSTSRARTCCTSTGRTGCSPTPSASAGRGSASRTRGRSARSTFHVPPRRRRRRRRRWCPDATSRPSDEVSVYGWTPEDVHPPGPAALLLHRGRRPLHAGRLRRAGRAHAARAPRASARGRAGRGGDRRPRRTRTRGRSSASSRAAPPAKPAGAGTPIRSWYDLLDLLADKLDPELGRPAWTGATQAGHADGVPAPADGARAAARPPGPLRRRARRA